MGDWPALPSLGVTQGGPKVRPTSCNFFAYRKEMLNAKVVKFQSLYGLLFIQGMSKLHSDIEVLF